VKAADFKRNRILWRSYCADRIDRAFEIDPRTAKLAFCAAPFLLHHNHPALPGFVRFDEPLGGITHYSPASPDLDMARSMFPGFFYLPYGPGAVSRIYDIESLFLMGSIGTVAQCSTSDFDYWVVVDKNRLSAKKMEGLILKLMALEEWAVRSGIEMHFFLSDTENVKNNDFGSADKESAGSSQPRSLKEEFYRTAIHVAGKDPLWWLLPPRLSNREYESKKATLMNEGGIGEEEFVDLGNAEPIDRGELYGALLWQLNKATTSPHKAVLKMALVERFISSGHAASLPCESLKEIVQSQAGGTFLADPYLLMIDYVRNRYLADGKKEEAKSLEQCFYLKAVDAAITLDEDHEGPIGYKERTLRQLLKFWGWKSGDLAHVNDYERWNIQKSGEMAAKMHDFILTTYRNIYNDTSMRSDLGGYLTGDDKTILGRKLFVIYDKRNPDKIEYLKRIMNEVERLEEITFSFSAAGEGRPILRAYMGDIRAFLRGGEIATSLLLREGADPLNIILWLAVNGVATGSTYVYFEPEEGGPVSPGNMRRILGLAAAFFHKLNLEEIVRKDLLSDAYVTRMLAAVNVFSKPGADKIETIHVMYSTSWGEVFSHMYQGEEGLEKIERLAGEAGDKFQIGDRRYFRLFVPEDARDQNISTLFIKLLSAKLPAGAFNLKPEP
jgi:adenylate cyclase class 1